jgi:hypothetical protein
VLAGPPGASLRLYDAHGECKHLTADEQAAFLAAAEHAPREV